MSINKTYYYILGIMGILIVLTSFLLISGAQAVPGNMTMFIYKGWNIISSPFEESLNLSKIAQQCKLTTYKDKIWAWAYDPVNDWTQPNQINKGEGVYILSTEDCVATIEGTPATFSSRTLKRGWNLISADTSFEQIKGDCQTPSGFKIWGFNPQTQQWFNPAASDKLDQSKGYWVAVEKDCGLSKSIVQIQLQSNFFKNDPAAQSIVDGNNYQLEKGGRGGSAFPDKNSFGFKIVNTFRQLGYAQTEFSGDESLVTFGLHTFQKNHKLPVTDFVDKNTLLLIDSELFQREKEDKKLAEQYPPFAKFIEGPAGEPSKEHLAALYSSFFAALPKNISQPTWTIDEFRFSLIRGLGPNLGVMMNAEGTNPILFPETIESEKKKGDFKFCGSAYYWQLEDNTCNNIEPSMEFSTNDYVYMALLLAHEYGHGIAKYPINLEDEGTDFVDYFFGKISFDMSGIESGSYMVQYLSYENPIIAHYNSSQVLLRSKNNDGEFISGYAEKNNKEDFAESFTAYMFQGNIFRERAKSNVYLQRKYDFLKRYVFGGIEYDTGSIESLNTWKANHLGIPFHPSDYLTASPGFIWDYQYPLK